MSNSILTEVACPNCLAPINLEGHTDSITCEACLSKFILEGHLCPTCSAYYKNEVDVCGRCGTSMTRRCLRCQTDNWAGDEYCKSCGVAMDLLDIAAHSHAELTAKHRERRLEQIRAVRAQTEESSRQRMAELKAIEQKRQAEIQIRKERQRARDIAMFTALGIFVVATIASVIVFTYL